MLEDLGRAPQGSIVLLHACAHNPVRDPGLCRDVHAHSVPCWVLPVLGLA